MLHRVWKRNGGSRRLHVEALERRALLAADLMTYGELHTKAELGGTASEWSGAAYWTNGTDEYVLLLESGDASAQREATIHRVSLTGDD